MPAPKTGPQDLPPPGGYGAIQYERIKLRVLAGGPGAWGAFIGMNLLGWYLYFKDLKAVRYSEIEMASSRHAITPMIEAERDRALLKYMKQVKDKEIEVMKNVPGWEPGTFYGEPVFYRDRPEFFEPEFNDVNVFCKEKDNVMRWFKETLFDVFY